MSPYRHTRPANAPVVLRLSEPITLVFASVALLVSGTFACLDWSSAGDHLAVSACVRALVGVALATFAFVRRQHACIVMVPSQERLRVVRVAGLGYSAATLRLSRRVSVEYSLIGKSAWLMLVAEDGRFARVLPATSDVIASGARERVEAALAAALGVA